MLLNLRNNLIIFRFISRNFKQYHGESLGLTNISRLGTKSLAIERNLSVQALHMVKSKHFIKISIWEACPKEIKVYLFI